MAQRLNPTRLRRILSVLSSPNHHHYNHRLPSTATASAASISLLRSPVSSSFRMLHSTRVCLSSSRSFNDVDKIDPDTILFEGCDYNHWLIVMDFGNDPDKRPSSEQMIDTYVQTLAKVVGSVEEAKKRMYACSTTTYTGFQAEIDEETSNKFEGMPGVVFILPDSYIDPVNKLYGGDQYINGTILPRAPPVHYGRVKRGRQYDPRPSGQMPIHQGNRGYNQDGSVPEGRGMPTQRQHHPPNYTPDQGDRSNPVSNGINFRDPGRGGFMDNADVYNNRGYSHPQQMNHSGGHGYVPHGQMTNAQGQHGYKQPQGQHSYNQPQGQRGYNQPQGQHGYNQPQGQHGYTQGQHGYNQPQGQHSYNQPQGQHGYNQPQGQHGYNHPQGQMRNLPRDHVSYPPQGQMNYPGDSRNFAPPPPPRGADGQLGSGSYQQYGAGRNVQNPNVADDQGANMGYPVVLPQVENQGFSEAPDEQNTRSTENRNLAQTGMNQERF